jgi:hypothetical protein
VATASVKDIVQSPSVRLRVGFSETQGVRRTMEDRMTVLGRYMGCDIGTHACVYRDFLQFLICWLFFSSLLLVLSASIEIHTNF